MKKRPILLLLFAMAAVVGSCVYDFNPQIDGEGGYMIVDGNIVIGEVSQVRLSYSWSLVDTLATQDQERMAVLQRSQMHVEDSKGGRYENTPPDGVYLAGAPIGYFDMRNADPSLEYRLVIENEKGTYASAWAEPLSPGQIDGLSYGISDDKSTMSIRVSAHTSDPVPSYYRWKVEETWEYRSQKYTSFNYIYTGGLDGTIEPGPDTVFRCWKSGVRPEIMTGSTEGLTEDRLVNHALYTLGNTDQRVSWMYAADVTQMRIPEEAYRYWEQMNNNATDVGGLFSPEPSEYRGNVANLDHPEELVLGYVGVMSVARKRLYVDEGEAQFYKYIRPAEVMLDTLASPAQWLQAYQDGKLPVIDIWSEVRPDILLGYEWWPARCVDCRLQGGTTRRPPEWPM